MYSFYSISDIRESNTLKLFIMFVPDYFYLQKLTILTRFDTVLLKVNLSKRTDLSLFKYLITSDGHVIDARCMAGNNIRSLKFGFSP